MFAFFTRTRKTKVNYFFSGCVKLCVSCKLWQGKITYDFFLMEKTRCFVWGEPPFRESCEMLAPEALGFESCLAWSRLHSTLRHRTAICPSAFSEVGSDHGGVCIGGVVVVMAVPICAASSLWRVIVVEVSSSRAIQTALETDRHIERCMTRAVTRYIGVSRSCGVSIDR